VIINLILCNFPIKFHENLTLLLSMKIITITLLIILYSIKINAQSPWIKAWDGRFGGLASDHLTELKYTSDHGLLLIGQSWSGVGGDKTEPKCGTSYGDFWIIKVDSSGNKQWDATLGGSSTDVPSRIIEIESSQFVIAGFSISDSSCDKSSNSLAYDFWMLKIDSVGEKLWDQSYGGNNDDKLYGFTQTLNGDFVMGGRSSSDSSGDKTQNSWGSNDYWIVRTDSVGNKLWDKTYGGSENDGLTGLIMTSDNGFLLGGYSHSEISGNKTSVCFDTSTVTNDKGDFWVVKIDSFGNIEWDKTYGGFRKDMLFSVTSLPNNNYLLFGHSNSGIGGNKTSIGNGGFDYWLIKIDSAGNIIWDKSFGGSGDDMHNEIWSMMETARLIVDKDNGYILAGASESGISGDKTESNLGSRQVWIVKVDSSGNYMWDKTIFTDDKEENGLITTFGDTCFAVALGTWAPVGGYITEPVIGIHDYWYVVFCQPQIYTGNSEIESNNIPLIYPNPFNSSLNISIPGNKIENVIIKIYDLTGRLLIEKEFSQSNNITIHTDEDLCEGVYLMEIYCSDKVFVSKIIKAH